MLGRERYKIKLLTHLATFLPALFYDGSQYFFFFCFTMQNQDKQFLRNILIFNNVAMLRQLDADLAPISPTT